MKNLVCAALIILTTGCADAEAQEALYPNFYSQGKQIILHGQGGASCGDFVENKQHYKLDNGVHYQQIAWMLGFLMGLDYENPYDTKVYDSLGLDLWVENYCRKSPIDTIANAAYHFYSYIGGRFPKSDDYSMWKHLPDYNAR